MLFDVCRKVTGIKQRLFFFMRDSISWILFRN